MKTLLLITSLFFVGFTIPKTPKISFLNDGMRIPITKGETKTFKVRFKNNGQAPLLINSVKSSCDCLEVSFDKNEIQTAQTSALVFTYDSKNQVEGLNKIKVEVKSNSPEKAAYILQAEVK